MLVLTRKEGQEIIVGNNIRLTVLAIRGNQVRLGFTAPGNVSILRDEISPKSEAIGTSAERPADLEEQL